MKRTAKKKPSEGVLTAFLRYDSPLWTHFATNLQHLRKIYSER